MGCPCCAKRDAGRPAPRLCPTEQAAFAVCPLKGLWARKAQLWLRLLRLWQRRVMAPRPAKSDD